MTLCGHQHHQDIELKYIDFDGLNYLLNDAINGTDRESNEIFLEYLNNKWDKYIEFVENYASIIMSYGIQKSVMIDILRFNEFTIINQEKLKQLILKYDENLNPFNNELLFVWKNELNFNPMIEYKISSLFNKISDLYQPINNDEIFDYDDKTINNEYVFSRKSIKFWIKNENVYNVIDQIIKYLPIYVFRDNENKENNNILSQQISSIYFDNDDLKCYESRISKDEGAKIIRLRWYGNNINSDNKTTIFIERKLHHKNRESLKQRFKLNYDQCLPFFKGKALNFSDNELAELQTEIVDMFNEYSLKPITRTIYKRLSFQLNDIRMNDIRISLDTNLTFIKEKEDDMNTNNSSNNAWPKNINIYDNNLNDLDDPNHLIQKFPFSVLEIKLSGDNVHSPPEWINDLMNSTSLLKSYKFSKYGHSVNIFYGDKLNIIPKWIKHYPQYFQNVIMNYHGL